MQKPLFVKTRYYADADKKAARDKNSIDALESLEDDVTDIESLDEIGEHAAQDEMNPDSDDAEDEMFLASGMGKSLMDDVDEYLREQEAYDEDEDEY